MIVNFELITILINSKLACAINEEGKNEGFRNPPNYILRFYFYFFSSNVIFTNWNLIYMQFGGRQTEIRYWRTNRWSLLL